MIHGDKQVLAAVDQAARYDRRIEEDIKKAIYRQDRNLFERIVRRVLARLRLTVADTRRFIDTAYVWFKNKL